MPGRNSKCSAIYCRADQEGGAMTLASSCLRGSTPRGSSEPHGHHAGSIFVRRSPDPEQFLALKDYSKRADRILNQDTQSTPTAPSTAELITRAQRGEEKAFEALFHQHWQRVYSLCLRMIGNTAEAEELTQDAFLQVFRKIHTFRGESAFSTWLHRLSANIVLMRLRKKSLIATSLEESTGGEESEDLPKEYGVPDLVLAGSIDRMHLERAIAQLPPGYKQAFVLHDVQGYEHSETQDRSKVLFVFPSRIFDSRSQRGGADDCLQADKFGVGYTGPRGSYRSLSAKPLGNCGRARAIIFYSQR